MTNSSAVDPISRSQNTIDTIEKLSKMGWHAFQEATPEEIKEYKAHLNKV